LDERLEVVCGEVGGHGPVWARAGWNGDRHLRTR
jgi:hypothetical protein